MLLYPLLIAMSDSSRRPFFECIAARLEKQAQYVTGLMELMAVTTKTYDRPDLVMVDRALLGEDTAVAVAIYQTLCLQFHPAPVLLHACFGEGMTMVSDGASDGIALRCAECSPNGYADGKRRGCFPSLDQIEQAAIEGAIRACGGNVQAAAAHLGIAPSTIYRRKQRENGGAGS